MTRRVIDARPPMGPRIATPVAAIERATARSSTGGSTPLATALAGPAVVALNKLV